MCTVVVWFFICVCCCFVNDTATTEIYTYLHTLSLHDALPISLGTLRRSKRAPTPPVCASSGNALERPAAPTPWSDRIRFASPICQDRKSGVKGKSVRVRVDLGGRGIMKKKKTRHESVTSAQRRRLIK